MWEKVVLGVTKFEKHRSRCHMIPLETYEVSLAEMCRCDISGVKVFKGGLREEDTCVFLQSASNCWWRGEALLSPLLQMCPPQTLKNKLHGVRVKHKNNVCSVFFEMAHRQGRKKVVFCFVLFFFRPVWCQHVTFLKLCPTENKKHWKDLYFFFF